MRNLLKFTYPILLLCITLTWACTSADEDSPLQSATNYADEKVHNGDKTNRPAENAVMSGGTSGLTLATINADPYTHLVPVPSGYTLQRAGIWDYNYAVLLIHTATGDTTGEVYVGGDRLVGGQVCTLEWDSTPTQVCCNTGGSSCEEGVSRTGIRFLSRCD